ncbi:MAG: HlyD family secretion protein, partial [Chloroflexota bacterium]
GASTVVLQIVDPSKAELHTNVDEVDVLRLRPGQIATLTMDALPGVTLTGSVRTISYLATTQSGVVTYDVTLDILPPSAASGQSGRPNNASGATGATGRRRHGARLWRARRPRAGRRRARQRRGVRLRRASHRGTRRRSRKAAARRRRRARLLPLAFPCGRA